MHGAAAMRRATSWALALLALGLVAGCDAETAPATEAESSDLREADPLGPEPAGAPTRHPIVLAHGFDASPTNRWGFYRVAEALRADGHVVIEAIVPPYDAPEVRGEHLADQIDAVLDGGAEKVNLVAHSMGGLDARHVIAPRASEGEAGGGLGYGDVVASLTTIASPHHGSPVADVMLDVLDGLHADDDLVNALASAWGIRFNELADDSDVRAALLGISERRSAGFAAENPDDPRVFVQSWAGVSSVLGVKNPKDRGACDDEALGDFRKADRMNATLVPMAAVVARGLDLVPNDGMVSVESAKYGEFRGCIPADHLDEVGQTRHDRHDARTGFDHVRFYRNLAFELAAKGF